MKLGMDMYGGWMGKTKSTSYDNLCVRSPPGGWIKHSREAVLGFPAVSNGPTPMPSRRSAETKPAYWLVSSVTPQRHSEQAVKVELYLHRSR